MTTQRTEIVLSAQDRASEVLRRLSGTVDGMQRSFDGLGAPLLRFQTLWASLIDRRAAHRARGGESGVPSPNHEPAGQGGPKLKKEKQTPLSPNI